MTTWTNISRASGTSWTNITKPTSLAVTGGSPIGLLLSLTYAANVTTSWTNITKASGTSWTNIAKAT